MANPIDFYFDFSSPYGYFASAKIDELAAKHGRTVTWRPILLGAVFKITGGQPLPTIPLKGSYAAHDLARSARLFKVPFKLPTKFPIGTHRAGARLLLGGRQGPGAGEETRAGALSRLLRRGPRHLQPGGDRQRRRQARRGQGRADAGAQRSRGQGAAARPRWTPPSSAACSARPTSWSTASRSGARTASTRSKWLADGGVVKHAS